MFRTAITTDPKVARRLVTWFAVSAPAMAALGVWVVILRDWYLLAVLVFVEADTVVYAMKLYVVGWPGSRLESYHGFPLARFSEAQRLLGGLVLVTAIPVSLIVIEHARNKAVLGVIALVPVVWLFRFVRAMQKEGWQGHKGTVH
jgi:hypothetical protein